MGSSDFRCSYSVASSVLLLFGVALLPQANAGDCDLFSGRWVFDSSYPVYSSSECPFIEREFSCKNNGRSDLVYTKYRWQPLGCDLARTVTCYVA
ncbi:hypothetical protein SLEP1_g17134 [Rubroshorea leprosula]|uniref:Trichome birefringence-like N-terminal domain-containing protein n=1 Tax=Rubroshorea leprosula TaxID=152421 RepID=A0AAV5J2H9_9ROSI|nr:hypothetical protein SLEP1_g17134 [Rubroshorea leprosula]